MAKLEDITVGSSVKGIVANDIVTIVAVQWYGKEIFIMAKKRYSYPVGICGPTILYTTIYAENAEEAARIRFEEKFDSFSEEQKKNVISYFEEQDNQRNNKKKKTQEKVS